MNSKLNNLTHNIINKHFKDDPSRKYREIYSYAKVYPNYVKIVQYKRSFLIDNFSTIESSSFYNEEHNEPKDFFQKSINRTKTKISDLALCNDFTHFVTFTFDPAKVGEENRLSFQHTSKLLKNWLKTEQQNHFRKYDQKFKYLVIPEKHKNGAWHFHALFQDYKNETLPFYSNKNPYATVTEIKKHSKKQKQKHFLTRYNLGRSEIEPIRDQTKTAHYIKKYITKELITTPFINRYWASRNLNRPQIIENVVSSTQHIPEEFKTYSHDFHNIYTIPIDHTFAQFILFVQEIHSYSELQELRFTKIA